MEDRKKKIKEKKKREKIPKKQNKAKQNKRSRRLFILGGTNEMRV